MFKLKKLFLISTILTLGLSSCSKNDSSAETPAVSIEGKWQYTKEGLSINNPEVLTDYGHASGCSKDYIEILPGNTIKVHYFNNPNCEENVNVGTWNRNNNSFVTTYSDQTVINAEIVELTNTTLKIKYPFVVKLVVL